ncbi:hypothetical protein RND71_025015 [Anisodus tanguticus]|uniref:Uncharacterized protein n=1 Tax=Anisodus tanguticus TaxID=243964 RepID=A0AAE1RRP6_9SOLA|nr:hypothetical protein RND71_025015 [Anisodus tanguticus]
MASKNEAAGKKRPTIEKFWLRLYDVTKPKLKEPPPLGASGCWNLCDPTKPKPRISA